MFQKKTKGEGGKGKRNMEKNGMEVIATILHAMACRYIN